MKILIVHLSDMHLKSQKNIILERKRMISMAIQNETLEINGLFIIVSGDVAYSGKAEEYSQAKELLEAIKNDIESYSQKKVNCLVVPGNHDCNYDKSNQVREILTKQIKENNKADIDIKVIDDCCKVQEDVLEFCTFYNLNSKNINKLVAVSEYEFDGYLIRFDCYNTAWISQVDEKPGTLYFPYHFYPESYINKRADLIIGILHHNFNWQNSENARGFREHIEKMYNLVLTGHEHSFTKSGKEDFGGNYTEYIEGDILQSEDNNCSGFNVIIIDLKNKMQKILNYKWNGKIYSLGESNKKNDWIPYKSCKSTDKNLFAISVKFNEILNDPGALFSHPRKPKIVLDDLFVFPDFRDLKIDKLKNKDTSNDILNSNCLCKIETKNKILIIGDDKSGKTSLCFRTFKHYHNNGYVPILIEGHKIHSAAIEEFNKLVNRCYTEEYSSENLEEFCQLENQKKLLIIDDFDESALSIKYRANLLGKLDKFYQNIIITANDLFQVEEIIYEGGEQKNIFDDYRKFQILQFGHLLRGKLIHNWNALGLEESAEENELIRKDDFAKHIIGAVIGTNFVPSHPLFLLTILQSIETGRPHDFKESCYGYYYQYLITQALGKAKAKIEDIDAYYNYLAELANLFFSTGSREIQKDKLLEFHNWHCKEYQVTLNFNDLIELFTKAAIFNEYDSLIKFQYRYIYYFFLAKYFSNNIRDKKIKQIISHMCSRLYVEEFANAMMFLVHHSKESFIIEEILTNAKNNFSKFTPAVFKEEIEFINKLMKRIPKLILEHKDINKVREQALIDKDKAESCADSDLREDKTQRGSEEKISELNIISQLNLAFKSIEILGQILKNYYGSLKGHKKGTIAKEAYLIGLRALNSVLQFFEKCETFIINDIEDFIREKKIVGTSKIEETSRKILFHICATISYSFIKKTSEALGSEKLAETFKEILAKNDLHSFHIIDMSIKLDFFKSFPYADIQKLKVRFSGNILLEYLLRRMVLNYLYMFETKFENKQRICNILGIPMSTQRYIDTISTQKKRKL